MYFMKAVYELTHTLNIPTNSLTLRGDNYLGTILQATTNITNIMTKSNSVGYLSISQIDFDGHGGYATNGLNLNDTSEYSRLVYLDNILIQGCRGYGLIMDTNEDSYLTRSYILPWGSGKAVSWRIPYGAASIVSSNLGYTTEIEAVQFGITDTVLAGLKIVGPVYSLTLIRDWWEFPLPSGNMIEIQTSPVAFIDQLEAVNCYFRFMGTGNLIQGYVGDYVNFKMPLIFVASGTGTFLPDSPTLQGRFPYYGTPRVHIEGGEVLTGTFQLTPTPWTPGVALSLDNWNHGDYGNVEMNETKPGSTTVDKLVYLKYPYPTNYYQVDVQPYADSRVWVTNQDPSYFWLHYSASGGVDVRWKTTYVGLAGGP